METNVIQLRFRANLLRNHAQLATESRRFHHMIASGALASVLFVVTLLNLTLSQNETKQNTRTIASVEATHSTRAELWKADLLHKMVQVADRKMASVASRPTDLDQLRFGLLEGKYSLKLESGRITEIEFQESNQISERPKYIDKAEFLTTYKDLVAADFETAQRVRRAIEDGKIVEEFELINSASKDRGPTSSNVVARVAFKSDESGRLLSMKLTR